MNTARGRRTGVFAWALVMCGAAQAWGQPTPTTKKVPPPSSEPDASMLLGFDLFYAPVGEDAPVLANLEFALTSRTLSLGYANIRSNALGYPVQKGLEAANIDGDVGLTQACYFCISIGKRIGSYGGGFFTAGGHYERFQTGTAERFSVTGVGLEAGYMRRSGPLFFHVRTALEYLVNDTYRGYRTWIDSRAFLKLHTYIAVYAHLGYARGVVWLDGPLDYVFDGPVAQLGLAFILE
jgi:hypothetical protein